ncbi:MAPEG family protein [Dokdonella soli]|uniref:MAPEG family protein n=1 Tax=Dokdonella soli TaxID=529810 RepID=A0ABN1IBK8_9GAMM
MTDARAIFWPAVALALLTLIVWLRLFVVRIAEMYRLRIHPQSVATSARAAERFVDTRAADNFRNLFELPVLFYVALGIAFAIVAVDAPMLMLAWLFVALRVLHSLIHCSYNRVMHRFGVYVASGIVLWMLWGWLAWHLLR